MPPSMHYWDDASRDDWPRPECMERRLGKQHGQERHATNNEKRHTGGHPMG